jgi:hypothetical protein
MNLRAVGRIAWNGVELASHEVSAVIAYAERLVAARSEVLDLATAVGLEPQAKLVLGAIELTIEETEKIKTLAKTLAEHVPVPEEPTPTTGAPPTGA